MVAPLTPYEEQYGLGESLFRGLAYGTLGLGESFGSLLHFLGFEDTGSGIEDYFSSKMQNYALPERLQGYVWDRPELLTEPNWWAHSIGNVVPTIAASLLPGMGATKVASIVPRLAPYARGIGTGVGTLSGSSLEGMGTYQEAREMGLEDPRLRGLGSMAGVAALNAIPLHRMLGPLSPGAKRMRGLGDISKFAGITGLMEGTTEALEEPWQAAMLGQPLSEGFKAGLNVFFPSVITGGLMGGGTSTLGYKRAPERMQKPSELAKAYEFLSPRTDEDMLTFEQAMNETQSPSQRWAKVVADDVDSQIGFGSFTIDAVGDTSAWGTENSMVTKLDNVESLDDVLYSAAWKGTMFNQKGVVGFISDKAGPDSIYSVEVPDSPQNVRAALESVGVPFRTLIPTETGTGVMVFDQGSALTENMNRFGDIYDTAIERIKGQGRILEGPTREEARQNYQSFISQYEQQNQRRYTPQFGRIPDIGNAVQVLEVPRPKEVDPNVYKMFSLEQIQRMNNDKVRQNLLTGVSEEELLGRADEIMAENEFDMEEQIAANLAEVDPVYKQYYEDEIEELPEGYDDADYGLALNNAESAAEEKETELRDEAFRQAEEELGSIEPDFQEYEYQIGRQYEEGEGYNQVNFQGSEEVDRGLAANYFEYMGVPFMIYESSDGVSGAAHLNDETEIELDGYSFEDLIDDAKYEIGNYAVPINKQLEIQEEINQDNMDGAVELAKEAAEEGIPKGGVNATVEATAVREGETDLVDWDAVRVRAKFESGGWVDFYISENNTEGLDAFIYAPDGELLGERDPDARMLFGSDFDEVTRDYKNLMKRYELVKELEAAPAEPTLDEARLADRTEELMPLYEMMRDFESENPFDQRDPGEMNLQVAAGKLGVGPLTAEESGVIRGMVSELHVDPHFGRLDVDTLTTLSVQPGSEEGRVFVYEPMRGKNRKVAEFDRIGAAMFSRLKNAEDSPDTVPTKYQPYDPDAIREKEIRQLPPDQRVQALNERFSKMKPIDDINLAIETGEMIQQTYDEIFHKPADAEMLKDMRKAMRLAGRVPYNEETKEQVREVLRPHMDEMIDRLTDDQWSEFSALINSTEHTQQQRNRLIDLMKFASGQYYDTVLSPYTGPEVDVPQDIKVAEAVKELMSDYDVNDLSLERAQYVAERVKEELDALGPSDRLKQAIRPTMRLVDNAVGKKISDTNLERRMLEVYRAAETGSQIESFSNKWHNFATENPDYVITTKDRDQIIENLKPFIAPEKTTASGRYAGAEVNDKLIQQIKAKAEELTDPALTHNREEFTKELKGIKKMINRIDYGEPGVAQKLVPMIQKDVRQAPYTIFKGDHFFTTYGTSMIGGYVSDSAPGIDNRQNLDMQARIDVASAAAQQLPEEALVGLEDWVLSGNIRDINNPMLGAKLRVSAAKRATDIRKAGKEKTAVITHMIKPDGERRTNISSSLVRGAVRDLKEKGYTNIGIAFSENENVSNISNYEDVASVTQNLVTDDYLDNPIDIRIDDETTIKFGRVKSAPPLTSPPVSDEFINQSIGLHNRLFKDKIKHMDKPFAKGVPGVNDEDVLRFREKMEFPETNITSQDGKGNMETISVLPPNFEEGRVLSEALGRVNRAGMPQSWLDLVDDLGLLNIKGDEGATDGMYNPADNRVLVRKDLVYAAMKNPDNKAIAGSLFSDLAHEFTHAVTIPTPNESFPALSPLFKLDLYGFDVDIRIGEKQNEIEKITYDENAVGEITKETLDFFNSDFAVQNNFRKFLYYPLVDLLEVQHILNSDVQTNLGPMPINMLPKDVFDEVIAPKVMPMMYVVQSEIMAQLGSMYFTFNGMMKKHMPRSSQLIEDMINVTQNTTSPEQTYSAIRTLLRADNPVAGAPENARPRITTETLQIAGAGRAAGLPIPATGRFGGQQDALRSRNRQGVTGPRYTSGQPVQTFKSENVDINRIKSKVESYLERDPAQRSDYEHINTIREWDINQDLNAMGEQEYPQLIGAAGHNPKTLEAISEIARLEGRNPEWVKKNILGRKEGSALNAPGVMAAVDFLRKETAAFKEYVTGFLAKRDAGEVTDQDYVDFQQRLMEHAHIHSQVMGIASEAGRALGVLAHTRKYYGEILDAESLDTMMNSMGGKGHIEDVADMMEAFLEGDIGKLNRYTSEVAEVRTIDKVFEAWVNALLSGPQTHVVNMTSNFLVSMNDDVVRLLASGIGKLHGGSKVYVREAVARMTSAPGAALSGMKMFSEALKDENFDDTLTKIEARHRKAIKGTAGKVIRMPGRFLSAEDLLFKKFTYVKEAHALAMHDHIENGTDYEATVDALLNVENDRLTPEQRAMRKKATEAADKATFTNPLGTFGRTLQKLANDHPSLRFIIPFIRTPTNIVKYAAQHSPVALFFKEFRQQFARGGAERDIAVARMTLGTSVGAAIAMLAAEGLVTGGGPDDPRERNILYSMGWQPYSFKIGNKYYSYGRLEPLGMIFGIAADIREMSAVASEEELESLVALFAGSFFKNVTSKTWLRGISDAINAITNPDRYGERWIQSMLGTVVPTGVAQVARTQDPVLRRRDDIRSTILSRTPLKSQDVLPRLGLWGEPVRLEGGVGPDLLSPVYISTQTLDPASAALRRISRETDWKPSTPSKKIHGVELTPEQHNQYIQLARRPAKAKLEMLASSPGFELLPVEVQKDLFKEIIDQSNKDAREMMVTMNPDLFIKGLEAQMKKAAGGF